MDSLVLIDSTDPQVTVITLNRPAKRNALSTELMIQLREAFVAAEKDRGRRVVIVRGEGPIFCAGLDLAEAAIPAKAEQSADALASLYSAIMRSPLVTIAAAHGAAFGGGAGLLAACDIVVAAEDLTIGFPEVHRGLVAALVTSLFRRQLGDRTMRELILLGQSIAAGPAREIGIINRVVPGVRLIAEAMNLASQACGGAPGAISRSKRLLDELSPRTIEADLKIALRYHVDARNSAESAEGIAAFREKREPKWGGLPDENDH